MLDWGGLPYQQAGQPGHVGLDGFNSPAVALSQSGHQGDCCRDDGYTRELPMLAETECISSGLLASFDLNDSEAMPTTAVTQPHLPPYRSSTRRAKKSNPPAKIRHLWNGSRFFHQIYSVYRRGFRPHILQILLEYLVAFENYNYLNLNVHFSK